MKKLFALVLAILLSLSSCGSEPLSPEVEISEPVITEEPDVEADEPEEIMTIPEDVALPEFDAGAILAKDFLMQFETAFSYNYSEEDFHLFMIDIDVIWIHEDAYATGFELWDFNNSGIPDIIIHFGGNVPGSGAGYPLLLYRYIDGEYKNIFVEHESVLSRGWFRFIRNYLLDPDGNLIARQFHYGGNSVYRIIFNDNLTVTYEKLVSGYHDNEDFIWENLITGEVDIPHSESYWFDLEEPYFPQYIPGMDTPLTPLFRLTDMEEDINTYIKKGT